MLRHVSNDLPNLNGRFWLAGWLLLHSANHRLLSFNFSRFIGADRAGKKWAYVCFLYFHRITAENSKQTTSINSLLQNMESEKALGFSHVVGRAQLCAGAVDEITDW